MLVRVALSEGEQLAKLLTEVAFMCKLLNVIHMAMKMVCSFCRYPANIRGRKKVVMM